MDILNKVTATIEKHSLLERGDAVLIGLSGGPDSVAMLHLLTRLRKTYKLSLQAVYVNHNLRPRAAKSEETFCRDLCKRFRIPLSMVRENIPALARVQKKGVEETAREVRYNIFQQLARQHSRTRIALGHHADDRAETVLFRVIRGTGRTGLLGIPVRRGKIMRPLFEVSKQEILAYLKERHLSFCTDRSNSRTEYSRNYLRNRLIPDIRRRLNPQVDSALVRLAELFDEEEGFLEDCTRRALQRVVTRTLGGKFALDLKSYSRYPLWARRRLLRHCLQVLSPESRYPDWEPVERLDELASSGGKGLSLPGGIQAVTTVNKLLIFHKEPLHFECDLPLGTSISLPALAMKLKCSAARNRRSSPRKKRGTRKISVDVGKVVPPLTVRSVRAGDRFRPLGLTGTKKLSDFLTDRKVPAVLRDEIPLLCDLAGIVWVIGYEIAERVKVTESTQKVLTVEVRYTETSPYEAI